MISMVGTWNLFVTWPGFPQYGREFDAKNKIFNADGTWTDRLGDYRGRWFQGGDQVVFNVAETNGVLVYAGNIQPGQTPLQRSITGIMGYLDGSDRQGTFRALRLPVDPQVVVASGGVPKNNTDPLLGPVAPDEG